MVKSRHREVEFFNANIGLLKQCIDDNTWRKLKRFIASDNSINEMEIDKFYRVIDTIPAEEWAKYLRKIRDKGYEENRSRISISRKTEEHLKRIVDEVGYKSIEDVLNSVFVNDNELKNFVIHRLLTGDRECIEAGVIEVIKKSNQKNLNENIVPKLKSKPKIKLVSKIKPAPKIKPKPKVKLSIDEG